MRNRCADTTGVGTLRIALLPLLCLKHTQHRVAMFQLAEAWRSATEAKAARRQCGTTSQLLPLPKWKNDESRQRALRKGFRSSALNASSLVDFFLTGQVAPRYYNQRHYSGCLVFCNSRKFSSNIFLRSAPNLLPALPFPLSPHLMSTYLNQPSKTNLPPERPDQRLVPTNGFYQVAGKHQSIIHF